MPVGKLRIKRSGEINHVWLITSLLLVFSVGVTVTSYCQMDGKVTEWLIRAADYMMAALTTLLNVVQRDKEQDNGQQHDQHTNNATGNANPIATDRDGGEQRG